MPIDEMFQEGTDKVLDDRVARPLPAPTVRPSFGSNAWNTTTAVVRGPAAGVNESGGFLADILGAYGSVQAGYGAQTDPTLLFDSKAAEARRAEGAGARAQVQSGEAFSSETGDTLRAGARYYMPDPATAGAAENLIFGLGRFMTKAVGYSVAAGPIAGAGLTGLDEAYTEADRLKAQGVDFGTRAKVGAVAGAVAGVSVALPIAGKTVAGTVGLVTAGGPGGFIAQQATSRAILQHAGYDKLAEQYDPFDPVGLAVSTLVPAAFGAYAMRGARATPAPAPGPAVRQLADMAGNERLAMKHDDARLDAYTVTAAQREGIPPEALLAIKNAGERSNPTAVSPAGAKGVMQFMPDTWAQYGKGDPRDPVASIDAGAAFMKDLIKQYGGDVRAATAHYNGGGKAGKAVLEGRAPPAAETARYIERTDAYRAEHQGTEAGKAAAADPEAVAAARVQLVRDTVESWNLKNPADAAAAQEHLSAVLRASDQMGAGQGVDVKIDLDTLGQARMLDDMAVRLESARAAALPDAGNVAEPGAVKAMREQIASLEQSRPAMTDEALREAAKVIQADKGVGYKAALAAATKQAGTQMDGIAAQIAHLERQLDTHRSAAQAGEQVARLDDSIAQVRAERAAVDAPTPKAGALAVKQAVADLPAKAAKTEAAPAAPSPKAQDAPPGPAEVAPAPKQEAGANPMAASVDAQGAEIARLSPDMMVQLEGMEKPMRLADALEAVKAEAARDTQDAPLLKVAAECFLRNS